jgi:hypothetical protein
MLGKNADPAKNFKITVPTPEDGTLTIERANGADVMLVAANGRVTFPGNKAPAFSAFKNALQSLTSGSGSVVLFDNEVLDTDNCYDPATGRFTPNVAGWYQVNASVTLYGNSNPTIGGVYLRKNATLGLGATTFFTATTALDCTLSTSALVYCNGTTDYVDAMVAATATNPYLTASTLFKPTAFSGFLVRAA